MNPTQTQTAAPTEAPDSGARRYQCRHIFAEGHRCRALSLRQEHFCYIHHTSRHPLPARIPTAETFINPDSSFIMPPLEDRASIQLAISELARRIAANQLDLERAIFLLRCCRHATANLPKEPRSAKPIPYEEQEIEDPQPLVEAFELDTILGPLAPIAEFIAPAATERPLSCVEQMLQNILDRPVACPTCHPTPPPEPAPFPFTLPTLQAVADQPMKKRCHPESSAQRAVEGPAGRPRGHSRSRLSSGKIHAPRHNLPVPHPSQLHAMGGSVNLSGAGAA
jgi:hypothetical protein